MTSHLVDPNLELRKILDDLSGPDLHIGLGFFSEGYAHPSVGCLHLCDTPRILKMALRKCLELWERYPGEIALDHLLVTCLVRADSESAFQALSQVRPLYIAEGYRRYSRIAQDSKRPDEVFNEYLRGANIPPEKHSALMAIAKFLFEPAQGNIGQAVSSGVWRNQKYWELILDEPVLGEEEKDQPILRILRDGSDEEVLTLFITRNLREAFRDFRRVLGPERALRILPLLVLRLSSQRPSRDWVRQVDIEKTQRPPGLTELWMVLSDLARDGLIISDELWPLYVDAIKLAVKTNLTLASELEYLFFVAAQETHPFFTQAQREVARSIIEDGLLSDYSWNTDRLASALADQSPPALLWLLWGLDRVRQVEHERAAGKPVFGGNLPFKEGWEQFANTLLRATGISPRACLPQLAWLLVRTTASFGGVKFKFDGELAIRLFGSIENLRKATEGQQPSEWASEPVVIEFLNHINKSSYES